MTENRNYIFLFLITAVIIGLLYLLAPILTPFLVGALLAYLFDPWVRKFTDWHIPRLLSVIIVFAVILLIFLLLLLVLIPLIEKQIVMLTVVVPNIISWMQDTIIPALQKKFGVDVYVNIESIKAALAANWMKAGGIAQWVWTTVLHSGYAFIAWATNLILIPVVTFYLLRDWNKVVSNVHDLLPRSIEPTVVHLVNQCDHVLSAFFRGQLLVMISLGIIYSAGLTLVGLEVGVVIGLLAGLMSIVPYLGFIVGVLAASIAAYVQFKTWTSIIWVILVLMVGQSIESVFLTPKLVGGRIGLHPVAVIFAVLTGGILFGFFGVLLALPAAAVIMVLIRYGNERYRDSSLYRAK